MSAMQAAVLETYGEPLVLREVPIPSVNDDEVLVRVRAAGVCGTDLKIMAGTLVQTPLPLIPGHEVAGEVAEDAGDLRRGQRVACYIYTACGQCYWCLNGQESICATATRIGFEEDGGMAQYIKMQRKNVLPFGAGLSFEAAAVAMDAVLTPWRALRVRARVQPGESVVIAGAGGLGLNGVQIALDAGATVAVIDPVAAHRAEAERLGAALAVEPNRIDEIIDWSGGGAAVGMEASGKRAGFDSVVNAVRDGGRIVCVGYELGKEYGMDSRRFTLQEMVVMGCRAGTLEDARDALAAVERGAITPTISERLPLYEANTALARLKAGQIVGRLVLDV